MVKLFFSHKPSAEYQFDYSCKFKKKDSVKLTFLSTAQEVQIASEKETYQITVEHYRHFDRTFKSDKIMWNGTIAAFLECQATENEKHLGG